jgi:hypothetical protein
MKQNVSETASVSVLRSREGDAYFVGLLRKSQPESLDNSRHITTSVQHLTPY